jgi:hypothetical protein
MTKHRVTRRPLIGDHSSVESRNHYFLGRIAGSAGSKSNSIAARGAQACRSMINGLAITEDVGQLRWVRHADATVALGHTDREGARRFWEYPAKMKSEMIRRQLQSS